MNGRYVLDDRGEAQPCTDLLTWGRWMQSADRHVAKDIIGASRVSTVFLGLDHSWNEGPPVLWETMVFGGPLDGEQDRYASRVKAIVGHQEMCARVRESLA